MRAWMLTAILLSSFSTMAANMSAQSTNENQRHTIVASVDILERLGLPRLLQSKDLGIAVARLNEAEMQRISAAAHDFGRCGGFERVPEKFSSLNHQMLIDQLEAQAKKESEFNPSISAMNLEVKKSESIAKAIAEIDGEKIRGIVSWLSTFHTRFHNGEAPNRHVDEFAQRLGWLTQNTKYISVEQIGHDGTPQRSIRVRVKGASKPNEILVLGGHLDSIAGFWGGARNEAPGADDNASGSASLVEILRVLLQQPQPQRTIEFMWYAGEEGGLIGSAEIAADYKSAGKEVIGVLQLDMTAFPGDGVQVVGLMEDFTSSWLNSYLESLNSVYVGATIRRSKCGYGCSDHASWHRNGFPAVMPHESTMNSSNGNIHTARDTIDHANLNFEHAKVFAQLGLAMALDLGNSENRQPY